MRTVTLDVRPLSEAVEGFAAAWRTGRAEDGARISFARPELLWRVLTERRWAILKALAGKGPMTIRALARLLQRDVKRLHEDVHALLGAGVIERTDDGRIVFPYDAVRVEFTLEAA